LLLQLLVIIQAVKNLLLGFVANGAGVVHHQVRFFHGFHLAVSLMDQRANDFF